MVRRTRKLAAIGATNTPERQYGHETVTSNVRKELAALVEDEEDDKRGGPVVKVKKANIFVGKKVMVKKA